MDEENLALEDLAALLDEDEDELFAMVDEPLDDSLSVGNHRKVCSTSNEEAHEKADCSPPTTNLAKSTAVKNSESSRPTDRMSAKSNSVPSMSHSISAQSSSGDMPSKALKQVESDLTLSDEEIDHPKPSSSALQDDDEDDPTESEIQALEAKLAKLKQKKQAKTSPKSLQDVVSKIRKPPSPNKSKFLDMHRGPELPTVVPVPLSQQTTLEERVRAMLRRPQSHVHAGDTDSSEDEDNRTPFEKKYNAFGREVKQRLAHSSASAAARDKLQERAEHVNRAANRQLKPKTAAKKADGGRPAVPEQPHEEVMLDSYHKMSVINPRLTQAELGDCLRDKRLIRVSQLESHIRGDTIAGDWVTVACIARKTEPRTSQKGSAYSSWTLTDLIDCQKPAKLMLFGDAHTGLWKTTVGTVVALANSKIMKDKDVNGSGGVSMSINSARHCIILGTSPDLDFCQAKCKNGRICLSFINKRHCPVCVFHMNAEYKKTGAKRGELQSMSGVAPRKPLAGQLGAVVHEGQLGGGGGGRSGRDSETAAQKLRDRQRLSSLKLQKQCEESIHTKKKQLSTLGLKHITQEEAKAIASVAETSVDMGEMLLKPCAGARNLLKHLTKDAAAAASSDVAEPGTLKPQRDDPAAMLRAEARRQADLRLPAPRLARNVRPGQTVDLDVSPSSLKHAQNKAKALALVRRSGGVKKADPNAVRSRPSQEARERMMKRLPTPSDENRPEPVPAMASSKRPLPADGAASKRSRLADDPQFRAVLEARSSHAAALEAELTEGQEHYFTALERKEMIENKMLSTWEVKTKAVYCKQCKYRALSASELCKSEGHSTVLLDAVKRFFACKNCKNRTVSIDKLPKLPCKNCGAENWQKAPMGKERTGPKLESEILSIRGNEAIYINSHVKEHNINLEF